MPLITDREMEDFNAPILQAGFEVDDFSVVDFEDEPTAKPATGNAPGDQRRSP